MKVARRFVLFLISALAVLSLAGCHNLPCNGTSPGSTGGSSGGASGGRVSNDTCTPGGGVGGIGVGSALLYYIDGSTAGAATLNGNAFGLVAGFTPPTLAGSGADDMTIVNGKFLYIPQASSFNVEGFVINRTNGALTPIQGSPFSVPSGSDTIAADPQGRFLFVGNESGPDIASFQIDPNTGALTPTLGSPITFAGTSADTFAVDGKGKFLYVGQMSNTSPIHGFAIDQTTGALTEITGSPFVLGISTPHCDASGNFLVGVPGFVDELAPSGDNHIYVFSIDPNTGVPTPVASSPTVNAAEEFAISPNGKFVYAMEVDASGNPTSMEGFQMDQTTGALTAIQGSPFTTLPSTAQCKFEQSGSHMFCADALFGSSSIVVNSDPNTGALSHTVPDLSISSFPFAATN